MRRKRSCAKMMKSLRERFETKYEPEPNSGCWLWTASQDGHGYGQLSNRRGVSPYKAHRIAYELFVGSIPDGLTLDHLCRIPSCVNPAHLQPVTLRENILRGVGPTSENAAKTYCCHGHELIPENTYIWSGPNQPIMRQCRLCRQRRKKEWYARQTRF